MEILEKYLVHLNASPNETMKVGIWARNEVAALRGVLKDTPPMNGDVCLIGVITRLLPDGPSADNQVSWSAEPKKGADGKSYYWKVDFWVDLTDKKTSAVSSNTRTTTEALRLSRYTENGEMQ